MPFKRTNKSEPRNKYADACHAGYCPTLKEIENSEIKKLANRLKAVSDKETLTNVLEWQDRNIGFWFERYPMPIILLGSVIASVVSLVFLITDIPILELSVVVFGAMVATVILTMILMISYYRKLPLKQLYNIFRPSIPINVLLENKLGVCRDYAKITACLLSNIYPDTEIYFAHAPRHVANGIVIENKLYMLDQHLPILTIDKWHILHPSKKKIQILKGNSLRLMGIDSFLSKRDKTSIDTQKLAKEITELLDIKGKTSDDVALSSLKIRREKGVKRYEDNALVVYSFARWLKMKISGEILELNQITKLEVDQEKEDLIFRISFKPNE